MPETQIDQAAQNLLFTEAHTPRTFGTTPVTDEQIRGIWERVKYAPTASNINPLRVVVVRSPEARARLLPLMAEGNRERTTSAPATLILAADTRFHEYLATLTPHAPDSVAYHEARTREEREATATFSALLQAGYFIIAVRAAGLNAGPMLGFDKAGVDAEFFGDGRLSALFVLNIGEYGPDPYRPRAPRLEFDQVVTSI
ncbi:MAG: malonic semialdehyde reductase [Thermoleophilia bacterium]